MHGDTLMNTTSLGLFLLKLIQEAFVVSFERIEKNF